ncbi:hypothetical protein BV25DRAFT_1918528 [Artomyces pyxidatus]|uniref:Uncharacterized protein n=1 Tax=Artomyces pyxidatus TaxID=48021 RepID=A0ACB8STM2_9AGAM|nr:hypothetical protein BV25DRAFT_1918528 [Artomyces pyxidatus]
MDASFTAQAHVADKTFFIATVALIVGCLGFATSLIALAFTWVFPGTRRGLPESTSNPHKRMRPPQRVSSASTTQSTASTPPDDGPDRVLAPDGAGVARHVSFHEPRPKQLPTRPPRAPDPSPLSSAETLTDALAPAGSKPTLTGRLAHALRRRPTISAADASPYVRGHSPRRPALGRRATVAGVKDAQEASGSEAPERPRFGFRLKRARTHVERAPAPAPAPITDSYHMTASPTQMARAMSPVDPLSALPPPRRSSSPPPRPSPRRTSTDRTSSSRQSSPRPPHRRTSTDHSPPPSSFRSQHRRTSSTSTTASCRGKGSRRLSAYLGLTPTPTDDVPAKPARTQPYGPPYNVLPPDAGVWAEGEEGRGRRGKRVSMPAGGVEALQRDGQRRGSVPPR